MPEWLNLDPTLTEERNQELTRDVLGRLERHVHPMLARNLRLLNEEFIEWRSEGCFVYDPLGQPYFDAVGAGGVFALGHSHPEVVQAVRRQLDRGGLSVRTGLVPGQLELLERLSRLVPGRLPYGYVGSTGTEAMEAALKLARLTTGRPGLVGMQMGYHGMSVGTLSISGISYWREGFAPLLEPVKLVPFGDLQAARAAIDPTTAAVFLEPVQWASACSVASPEYLQGLRRICDEAGALLILDEIQCGLGRTGRWFAAEHSGVVPDMISVGKTLSGGIMPVSALMFSQRVQEAALSRPLFNNSTYGGNPLACAAALATLDVLEHENLIPRAAALGERLEAGLETLRAAFPSLVSGQQGQGLMRCVLTRDPRYGLMISTLLMKKHRMILPSMSHAPHVLRMSPPFICTEADIDRILEALRESCSEVRSLGLPGIDRYIREIGQKLAEGS